MNPAHWDRVQRLFREALERPRGKRIEFLREHVGDDDVRREVESLLRHHELSGAETADESGRQTSEGNSDSTRIEPRDKGASAPDQEAVQKAVGERYRIEHVAGTGGMGHVFTATDTVLERRVAIKVLNLSVAALHGSEAADQEQRNRILAEARAMAGLRHPNLCPVHEACLDGALPYLIMDWIDGVDLRVAWRNASLERRLPLFLKVVEAVAAAHAAELVHADLKPVNVLVDRMGEPIIVDFGLARSMSDAHRWRHVAGGTPGYASPEQFDPEHEIRPTADVYALGAMMYEMLTDHLPYDGFDDMVRAAREEDPPLPETLAPDVPWPIQRICLVALERNAQRRYPDAHAMAADLHRYLRGESVAARPSMLTERFVERVEQQIWQVDSWHRQGLVTHPEAIKLNRVLSGLLRPESHWILESRRLTWSQVTLYLGGWLALIALAVGLSSTAAYFGFDSDALGKWPWLRPATAWTIVVAFFGIGLVLQQRGHERVSLGYQVTACLAVPVAIWLLLRETGWLAGEDAPDHDWLHVLSGARVGLVDGLFNRQFLMVTFGGLFAAVGLRRLTASSAFTLVGVLGACFGAVAAYACAGLLSDERSSKAVFGLWLAIVGSAAVFSGLRLNRAEEEHARQYGQIRTRTRDSWAVLLGAVLMIGIGLTLMAWYAADVYTLGLLGEYDDRSTRAAAFIINGAVLQVVAHVLSHRRTLVRARLAEVIRWVSPSHFLGGLWILEREAENAWLFWLVALALASIALCYISVWKQWRPFLVTGLVWVAVAYGRAFRETLRFEDNPSALDRARLALAGALLVVGIVTMILAWKLPEWRVWLKLTRGQRRR